MSTLTTHHPVLQSDPCACGHTLRDHSERHCHHAACGCTSWRKPGTRPAVRADAAYSLADVVAAVAHAAEAVGQIKGVSVFNPTRGMPVGRVSIRVATVADVQAIADQLGLGPVDVAADIAMVTGEVTTRPLAAITRGWTVKVKTFLDIRDLGSES